jgi:hypothetical protein
LQDGEDVAGRVLEPGDVGAAGSVDALVVLAGAVIFLQHYAPADQFVDGRVDVIDGEVEDREGRGGVIGLGVDQRVPAAGQVQGQQALPHVMLLSMGPIRTRGIDAGRTVNSSLVAW